MVRIVQCLCPNRHAIVGIAYEPGFSIGSKFGNAGPVVLTEQNAAGYLKLVVEYMLFLKHVEGTCGICGSPERVYDDQPSIFKSMEEALPAMLSEEEKQRRTRAQIDAMRKASNN